MGTLYLLPNVLSESPFEGVLPQEVTGLIKRMRVFATENPKNTRRFLKRIDKSIDIDSLQFLDLNEHSTPSDIEACLSPLKTEDVGIISEAGCPGIADPGAELVALAHRHGYRVRPLVGPSSILLALMASGCSGQRFSFNGYLPVKGGERVKALKNYEKESVAENRSEVFIETPYRNQKLLQEMLDVLSPQTKLTVACNLTAPDEFIRTKTVREWKEKPLPDLNDRPTVFILYAR